MRSARLQKQLYLAWYNYTCKIDLLGENVQIALSLLIPSDLTRSTDEQS